MTTTKAKTGKSLPSAKQNSGGKLHLATVKSNTGGKQASVARKERDDAFFQDSDDAEMGWTDSDADGDESEEHDDDDDEEDEDDEQFDFDEQEFVDSEDSADEEELDSEDIVDSEEEPVSSDVESVTEAIAPESHPELAVDASDSDVAVNENDLLVPSAVSHTNNPLLQFFWKLADEDKSVRLVATSALVEHIRASQAVYTAPEAPRAEENVFSLYDSGKLAVTCCPDLAYTIKRLLKGLGASRDSSRLGFMLALMSVYHCFADLLDASVLLQWSLKLTSAEALGGSVKRREERLLYVARIFALGALFRTGVGLALPLESRQTAADAAVSVGKKKSFLREGALEVLVAIAHGDSEMADYVLRKMAALPDLRSEALAFALIAQTRHGFSLLVAGVPEFLSEFPNPANLLSRANMAPLLDLLKEVSCTEGHLHCIWEPILTSIGGSDSLSMDDFMTMVVEAMFLNSTGLVKRSTGLMLLQRLTARALAAKDSLGFLFTPTVLRTIKGSLGMMVGKTSAPAGKEAVAFNRTVVAFFRDLLTRAAGNEGATNESAANESAANVSLAIDLIQGLSVSGGHEGAGKSLIARLCGDEATASRLYARLDAGSVMSLVDAIAAEIRTDINLQEQSLVAFQAPFDKLISLVRNDVFVKLDGASLWIERIAVIFSRICVCPTVTEQLKEVAKSRLYVLLNELSDPRRFPGVNWTERVGASLLNAARHPADTAVFGFSLNVDEPTADALADFKAMEKLVAKQQLAPERLGRAVATLQSHLSVLLFTEPIDAIPVIGELRACLESSMPSAVSKKKSSPTVAVNLNVLMPVLVDVLMTFLAKATQFTRKMCDVTFRHLIPLLTSSALDVLLQILKSSDSEAGKASLFDEVDDEEMAEDSGEESEMESEMEEEATGEQHMAASTDSDSEELSDFGDDQMMAVDAKLAQIFQEKRKLAAGTTNSKTRVQEAKRTVTQFKFKVFDLLNLAMRSGDLPMSVRIASIEGLLAVLKANVSQSSASVEQRQFQSKLESFFADAFGRPGRPGSAADRAAAETLACKLLDEVAGGKTYDHSAVLPRVSQCVWFLLKFCRNTDASDKFDESMVRAQFVKVLRFALQPEERCFRVVRSFVLGWTNWDVRYVLADMSCMTEAFKTLFPVDALRPFQRAQFLEFVSAVVKSSAQTNKADTVALLTAVAEALTPVYAPVLSDAVKGMKIKLFREDIKFATFCSKKHQQLDAESGVAAWSVFFSAGLAAIEEFWKTQPNPNSGTKSFLGQIRAMKN